MMVKMDDIKDEEIKIVLARLKTLPPSVTLNIGGEEGFRRLNKNDLINEVETNSVIGGKIIEMYMDYLKSFK